MTRALWLGGVVGVFVGAAALAVVKSRTSRASGENRPPARRNLFPESPQDLLLQGLSPELRALYRPPAPGSDPKIVFAATVVDCGTMNPSDVVKHSLDFCNTGSGDLRILALRPRCGCTIGEIRQGGRAYTLGEAIPPGSAGSIDVTLSTAGYSGEKIFAIDVLTNDWNLRYSDGRATGIVRIDLKANVRRSFEFSSGADTIEIPDLSYVHGGSASVVLRSISGSPFTVGPCGGAPPVEIEAEPVDDSRSQWSITARVRGGAPLGPFQQEIRIPLTPSDPGAPKSLPVRVLGFVRGSVRRTPAAAVHFGVIRQGNSARQEVTLEAEGKTLLRVRNVRLEGVRKPLTVPVTSRPSEECRESEDFVTAEVEGNASGARVQIVLHVSERAPRGSFTRFLRFETGVPDGPPAMEVPVTGFVR